MRSSEDLDLNRKTKNTVKRLLLDFKKKLTAANTEVLWGKTSVDIPCKKIVPFEKDISAAHSGPDGGVSRIWDTDPDVDGLQIDWEKSWHHRAYGMATSLYEKSPDGTHLSGDPIADVFAVVARPNNSILVLADGVNWGEKALLAARSAVKGCMEYLNKNLFDSSVQTTHDIMEHLVHSFQHAQKCITDAEATMTTLCAGVVCELQGSNNWGFCTLNVGDSLAFVYNRNSGLREVTIGSHCDVKRDMCNPGGSLGRVDGYNPDLTNLTCSFTLLEEGDIVFLTSDGVTDNFDPLVCKPSPKEMISLKEIEAQEKHKKDKALSKIVEFGQRHCEMIDAMKTALNSETDESDMEAMELVRTLVSKVFKTTNDKRRFMETALNNNDPEVCFQTKIRKLKKLPGKLDHACLVANEVGRFPPTCLRLVRDGITAVRQWSHDSGYKLPKASSNEDSVGLSALDLAYLSHVGYKL